MIFLVVISGNNEYTFRFVCFSFRLLFVRSFSHAFADGAAVAAAGIVVVAVGMLMSPISDALQQEHAHDKKDSLALVAAAWM